MTSLDPDDIKRVKVHAVKCPKCKLTPMVKPDEKVCPVCGGFLLKKGRSSNVLVRGDIEQGAGDRRNI
jgi:rRNA maturation endonuclease Nob1